MRQKLCKMMSERATLVARMENLLGKTDARSLNESEQEVFDALDSQVSALDHAIAVERDTLDHPGRTPGQVDAAVQVEDSLAGRPQRLSQRDGAPDVWADSDGRQYLALGPQHRLADYVTGPALPAGTTRRDLRGSLGRIVRAKITGTWRGAEIEREMLAAAGTGDNVSGGYTVPNPLASFWIDLARAQSVCVKAGARVVPMDTSDLRIARVAGDPTVTCKAENDAFTDSGPTFDSILLTPWTIGCYMTCSRELAADSPNFTQIVEETFSRVLGQKFDYYCLSGSGSQQPTGLCNSKQTGLNTITSVGAPAWDDYIDAVEALESDNELPATAMMLPSTKCDLAKLLKNSEANNYATPPTVLDGIPRVVTNQLAAGFSVVGDFSQMLIGLRQDIMIEVSTEGGDTFAKHQVGIKATLRGDVALARGTAFVVLSGITT